MEIYVRLKSGLLFLKLLYSKNGSYKLAPDMKHFSLKKLSIYYLQYRNLEN